MATVGYEQARGLGMKYQMPDGYKISRSKTMSASAATLFAVFSQPKMRRAWLDDEIAIGKARSVGTVN